MIFTVAESTTKSNFNEVTFDDFNEKKHVQILGNALLSKVIFIGGDEIEEREKMLKTGLNRS